MCFYILNCTESFYVSGRGLTPKLLYICCDAKLGDIHVYIGANYFAGKTGPVTIINKVNSIYFDAADHVKIFF